MTNETATEPNEVVMNNENATTETMLFGPMGDPLSSVDALFAGPYPRIVSRGAASWMRESRHVSRLIPPPGSTEYCLYEARVEDPRLRLALTVARLRDTWPELPPSERDAIVHCIEAVRAADGDARSTTRDSPFPREALPRVTARNAHVDRCRIDVLRDMPRGQILSALVERLQVELQQIPELRRRDPFIRLVEVRMRARPGNLTKLLELRRYPQVSRFPELYSALYDYDLDRLVQDQLIFAALDTWLGRR